MTKASYFGLQNQIVDFHHGLLVLLCYKIGHISCKN